MTQEPPTVVVGHLTAVPPSVAGRGLHAGRLLLGALVETADVVAARTGSAGRDREPVLLDLALGSVVATAVEVRRVAGAFAHVVSPLARVVSPLAGVVMRPPLLDPRLHPERLLRELSARGRAERTAAARDVEALARALVPWVVNAVLDQIDLTSIVLDRVDVDAVAGTLDLEPILARVDVDSVVARADLDPVIARLDLNQIAAGLDVDQIAARLDLDAVVDRIDILGLAVWVVDGIDLPKIIRESSGGVASEAVRGVRMQSVEADEAVNRVVDRLLLRRRARRVETGWGEADAGASPESPRVAPGEGEPS